MQYDGVSYNIYNEVANQYRLVGNGLQIWFECEWRGGSYFNIRSVTYGGRTYWAYRYQTKYIPIVREATFIIAQNHGLWDYEKNRRHYLKEVKV